MTGKSVVRSLKNDTSKPLRDAPPAPKLATSAPPREGFLGERPVPKSALTDPAEPAAAPPTVAAAPAPATTVNFDGVNAGDNGAAYGVRFAPPDTNGEVGPNHYVQMVNSLIAVYSKTGVLAAGFPKKISALWTGFGAPCDNSNDGDPVVLFDQLAGRWVVTQFALPGGPAGFHECIAVSTTNDPTGAYNRYDFLYSSTRIGDYPKFGVWPDGYYMSTNEFLGVPPQNFLGVGVVAFDRAKMLLGQPATFIKFTLSTSFFSLLPADLDGTTLPPAGAPNPFVEMTANEFGDTDSIRVFRFHADFGTPANSTFTGPTVVAAAAFDPNMCNFNRSCIPQPGTAVKVDAISSRLMFRAAYRNFGGHEALVVNHTVDVGGDHAGVRWYELRSLTSGTPTIFQQGTQAPDADHRWMGSVAQDRDGNMAVGYSVSSTATFPSIRYAGRLAGDPAGNLPLTEATLIAGTGSETQTSRWGDYSDMTVDPTDDCTFWYTSEYMAVNGNFNWRTRIGAFKIPGCGAAPPVTALCASPPAPVAGDIVLTAGNDTYTATNPAGERIFALDGQDTVTGGPGPDIIFGGPGNDRIDGGGGADILCGGDGSDLLLGGPGNDSLSGDAGNDDLRGGDDDDALFGGQGFDRLDGGAGTNTNDGGTEFDSCVNGTNTNCP